MDIYKLRANVLKALAHPDRLRIYEYLSAQGESCVCDMADALGISQPSTSKHIALMRDTGLLESRRDGAMVHYSVAAVCLMNIFTCLDRSIGNSLKRQQDALSSLGDTAGNTL
ncbi:MAG TPA: metalloregulator ArsR/SmtB family transcription factor [Bacillota bacterium]|nr:metalloregulator ArsR/SmtB family transcription factor [Bacillota bacterium]